MADQGKLRRVLLLLRVSVFVVMLVWTVDKFVRPAHASSVYETFYLTPALGAAVMYAIGVAELLLISAFLLGYKKQLSYGLVFLLHAISTLSTFKQYLAPYDSINLLFFAAWPMLAACWALYSLREHDTLLTVG